MTSQELEKSKSKGRHYNASEVEAQANEALRLKILGTRDIDIAAALGLSRPTVAKRIRHAIDTTGPLYVAEYREIAKQRYEVAIQALAPGVAERDPEALRLWLDATAKYARLVGAEAPPQVEMHVTVETEQERGLREMLAQAERDEKARETVIVEGEVVTDA